MIYNLINALYYSFIFYIAYSVLYRVIEIKKYVKKYDGEVSIEEEGRTVRIILGLKR